MPIPLERWAYCPSYAITAASSRQMATMAGLGRPSAGQPAPGCWMPTKIVLPSEALAKPVTSHPSVRQRITAFNKVAKNAAATTFYPKTLVDAARNPCICVRHNQRNGANAPYSCTCRTTAHGPVTVDHHGPHAPPKPGGFFMPETERRRDG